jgi:hypothetical protein
MTNDQPIAASAHSPSQSRWVSDFVAGCRRRVELIQAILVAVLGSWFIATSIWTGVHNLSYGNELIGGPLNLHEHLLGSNLDWEQDLRYLVSWASVQSDSTPIFFENFDSTATERICVGKFATTRQTEHGSDRSRQEELCFCILNARSFTDRELRSGAPRTILGFGPAAWPYGVRIAYTIRAVSLPRGLLPKR